MSTAGELPPGYALGSWWYYAPNKAAPIAFAVFFAVSTVWHLWQCHKYGAWKAMGVLCFAGTCFTAGFVLRAIGAFDYTNLDIYISSTVLLLASPPFYEASNFFTLGRILYYVPYHAPMHPGRVATTFAFLQVVVETLNASGGSRVGNPSASPSQQEIGKGLLEGALLLQLLCMVAFLTLAMSFEYRCRKAGLFPRNLRLVLRVLYTSCLLITTRTVYRTIEWFEDEGINIANPTSFPNILRNEWFLWVFEAMLMCMNTFLLNFFHPSRFLPRNLKIYLATDGVTEIEGHGFEDTRHFLLTIVDPFDIGALVSRRGRTADHWEQQANAETVAREGGTELANLVTERKASERVQEV